MKACSGIECKEEAKFQCPTCLKCGIFSIYFCSQDCFKKNWAVHKLMHPVSGSKSGESYNPWPYYTFSGKLRPYPLSPTRKLPDHIQRPDYSEDGKARSELAVKGSNKIEVLNEEEIKKARYVCKVCVC